MRWNIVNIQNGSRRKQHPPNDTKILLGRKRLMVRLLRWLRVGVQRMRQRGKRNVMARRVGGGGVRPWKSRPVFSTTATCTRRIHGERPWRKRIANDDQVVFAYLSEGSLCIESDGGSPRSTMSAGGGHVWRTHERVKNVTTTPLTRRRSSLLLLLLLLLLLSVSSFWHGRRPYGARYHENDDGGGGGWRTTTNMLSTRARARGWTGAVCGRRTRQDATDTRGLVCAGDGFETNGCTRCRRRRG